MPYGLQIERAGGDAEHRIIAGPERAGGADPILLPGTPPAAVALVPCATGVVVTIGAPGARVGGVAVARGESRLMRPGERVELGGHAIALAPPPRDSTRAAAGALLRIAATGEALPTGPHLVVLSGVHAGEWFALGADQTIGRARAADLRLDDPRASRHHVRIRVVGGSSSIEDLRSKNGLFVNGVRSRRAPRPLRPGDVLSVGETSLAFEDPGAVALPPPHGPAASVAGSLPGTGGAEATAAKGAARTRLLAAALLALGAGALAAAS